MNTTAQVKKNIKKSLKQMGDEPLEVLKTAKKQVGMPESSSHDENTMDDYVPKEEKEPDEELKKEVAESDRKNLNELESEIRQISEKKLFDTLLQRIQSGENVPVEEFQELSHEERAVLKAQLEATKNRMSQQQAEKPLVEPQAKQSRRLGGFVKRKTQAEKQQTRVEMPLPPSG